MEPNTWGISGPAFLAGYGVLIVLTLIGVLVSRRRRPPTPPAPGDDVLDEYGVAMLNGGRELAATVALVNLDRRGSVELADRLLADLAEEYEIDVERLTASGAAELGVPLDVTLHSPPDRRAHPVERAVYAAAEAADPRLPGSIVRTAARGEAVTGLHDDLVRRGLLVADEEFERQRRQWQWFVPVLVLGLFRLAYGISRGKPVLYLIVVLAAVVGLMVWVSRSARLRTRAGDRAIGTAKSSARTTDAMALALYGPNRLWLDNPALALALAAPGAPAGAAAASRSENGWWYGFAGCGGGGGGGGGCGGGGCGG